MPEFAGLPLQVGGTTYVMPPLNAKGARAHWPRMLALQRGEETDVLGITAEVVLACLRRNYPAITLEQVEEFVDLGNCEQLMAMAGGNGSFRRWAAEEAARQAAEGKAPIPTMPATAGTGAPSTPASPPPSDTAPPTSTS